MTHLEALKQKREEHEAAIERRKEFDLLERENQKTADAQRIAFLKGMTELNVDLTKVLVAENRNPDKLIKIDGDRGNPQLHLHEG